jgi:hypothetical protein
LIIRPEAAAALAPPESTAALGKNAVTNLSDPYSLDPYVLS